MISRIFYPVCAIATLVSLSVFPRFILAQEHYTWKNVKVVAGGYVPGIVFSVKQPGLAYCRTDIGSFYKWDSTARQWLPLCDWCGQSNLMGGESIAADPQDANGVYLAAGMYTNQRAAIMRSRDQGKTFDVIDVPFVMGGNADGRTVGERLAIDPGATNILYFASRQDGLWKSEDYASTWKKVEGFPVTGGAGVRSGAGLSFVVFDPSQGDGTSPTLSIFAGSAIAGETHLYHSVDGGVVWNAVPGEPANLLALKADIDSRGMLYVTYANAAGPNGASSGAVWKYDTHSGDWTDITPVQRTAFCGVSVDRQHPGTLLVSTLDRWNPGDDVFRTTDDGKTWKSLRESAAMDISLSPYLNFGRTVRFGWWISGLALDPFDASHAMYGTGATIYGTHNLADLDAGKKTSWSVEADGMEETAIICLTSPTDGAHLISGFGDIGGFVHDDLDASPREGMFTSPVFTNCDSLASADLAPNVVIRQGRSGNGTAAAISEDGGHHWRQIALPGGSAASTRSQATRPRAGGPGGGAAAGSLVLCADGVSMVYDAGAPQVSADHGKTWKSVQGLPGGLRLVADRVNTKTFYALDAAGGRVFTSNDGGANFNAAPSPGLPAAGGGRGGGGSRLYSTLGMPGDLWIAGGRSLLHSTDAGITFSPISQAPSIMGGGLCFGFGKAAPGRSYPALFAAGNFKGIAAVWRSDDVGATWIRVNDDQHQYGTRFRCLCGDPRVYGRVYVGTDGRGIVYGDMNR